MIEGIVCCYGGKGAKDSRLPSCERKGDCYVKVLWRKWAAIVHWKWNLRCLVA
jgi:hypothetical protein